MQDVIRESPPPLKVNNLSVVLGGKTVLHDIHVEIKPASFVALVGPNGAGKTTFLRSILGIIPKLSGRCEVGGKTGAAAAKAIGYVPQRQEFAWDYPISVENVVLSGFGLNIPWYRRPGKEHWQAVYTALEKVQLWEMRSRQIGQLSGGQKQRVLIARALVNNPYILLLDEPFTGLDQPTTDLLMELFQDLAASGAAILMSTHDLTGAICGCDRLILLNRTVIADGNAIELAADTQIWQETYTLNPNSPLLATVKAGLQYLQSQTEKSNRTELPKEGKIC